ncbi:MAG: hypothetical protein RIQ81_2705, partial [Pseudomonadota bacterium]
GFVVASLTFTWLATACDNQQLVITKKNGSELNTTQDAVVTDELDGLIAKAEGLLLTANQLKDQQLVDSLTLCIAKLKELKTETDPAKLIRLMAAITVEMQSFDLTLSTRIRDNENRISKLEEGFKTLEGAISGLRENFTATLDALEVRLGDRIVQVGESLQGQIDQLKTKYDGLEADFKNMDSVLDKLEALGLEDLKTDWLANREIFEGFISSTNVEIANAKGRITALESAHAQQVAEILALQAKDMLLDQRITDLTNSTKAKIEEVRTELITRQDSQISGLQSQFNALSETVSELVKAAEALKELEGKVATLASNADQMQGEIDILNLAKDRAEVIAAIKARMEVALAWAALRTGHIDRVFCKNGTARALSIYDYRAANEANAFCRDKLAVLRDATVTIQTVKGILDSIAAANINDRCNLQFAPQAGLAPEPAESLSDYDLAGSVDLRNAVIRDCSSGPVRVRALLIESLSRLDVFPEFRTVRELQKMAPAARRYLIGSIARFPENFNPLNFSGKPVIAPTADELISTAYGKIERVFRESYIARRYRMAGDPDTFPPTPSQIGPNPAETVYTRAEIVNDAGLENVEKEEITNCAAVATRSNNPTNALSLVKASGSACFPYPSDPVASCPVNDDFALLRDPSNPASGAYVYEIFYQGINEVVRPKLLNGSHLTIGSNGSSFGVRRALGAANLPRTRWITVSAPYAALGSAYSHCQKFTLVEMIEHGTWVHPGEKDGAGNKVSEGKSAFDRYLNGFDWSGAGETSVNPVFPAVSGGVTLPTNLHARYLNSVAHARSMPLAFYYDLARPVAPFDVVKPAGSWSKIDLAAFKDLAASGSRSQATIQMIGIAPAGKIVSQLTGGNYWGLGTLRYFGQAHNFDASKPLYSNSTAGSHSSAYVREQELAAGIEVMDGVACDSIKVANPFSTDVSGRKVIFERSKYHLIEGFGGRCSIDIVSCAAFKGQPVFGRNGNFYQNHLNTSSPGPDGNLAEIKGDRCEFPPPPAGG